MDRIPKILINIFTITITVLIAYCINPCIDKTPNSETIFKAIEIYECNTGHRLVGIEDLIRPYIDIEGNLQAALLTQETIKLKEGQEVSYKGNGVLFYKNTGSWIDEKDNTASNDTIDYLEAQIDAGFFQKDNNGDTRNKIQSLLRYHEREVNNSKGIFML